MCYLVPTFGFYYSSEECWSPYGMQNQMESTQTNHTNI